MARKLSAADLIFRRPVLLSDTYELHAGNVRVAVVDPTFDCTGDRIVTLYRDGLELEAFRVIGWSTSIPQLVADRLNSYSATDDKLSALVELSRKLKAWEERPACPAHRGS